MSVSEINRERIDRSRSESLDVICASVKARALCNTHVRRPRCAASVVPKDVSRSPNNTAARIDNESLSFVSLFADTRCL